MSTQNPQEIDLVIVLAAGEGTRMKSSLSKVLHPIAGTSVLDHVIRAVSPIASNISVVVGAHRESVEGHLAEIAPQAKRVFQAERNGTGHAVQLALAEMDANTNKKGKILVVAGDTPLLRAETLRDFALAHDEFESVASVLTAVLPDPTGYGRIVRDEFGAVVKIVEERDADEETQLIDEINTGVYIFDIDELRATASKLTNNNSQGELYLTDVIAMIKSAGKVAVAIQSNDYTETLGINDRSQLAECAAIMRDRINHLHMVNGVTIVDPETTWIDVDVVISNDVTILPGTALRGSTRIASGAVIGPRSTLTDVAVGEGASIVESVVTSSEINSAATVGPFSFIRPGTHLASGAKVGAYVEIKNSTVGEGSKVRSEEHTSELQSH